MGVVASGGRRASVRRGLQVRDSLGCGAAPRRLPASQTGVAPVLCPLITHPSSDYGPANDEDRGGRKFRNARPMGLIGVVHARREPSGSDPEHHANGLGPDRGTVRGARAKDTREGKQTHKN